MRKILRFGGIAAVMSLTLLSARAAVIIDITDQLDASDPTQLGRLNRNSVISDWSAPKAFPGVINPAVVYHYTTYTIPATYPFIQISFDDLAGSAITFASAYLNTYTPTGVGANLGLDLNYLGDAGASGNFFGDVPRAFQVILPARSNLVVVVNDSVAANGGLAQPYRILVEGFYDSQFSDVPEPASATLICGGLGLCGLFAAYRRRRIRN